MLRLVSCKVRRRKFALIRSEIGRELEVASADKVRNCGEIAAYFFVEFLQRLIQNLLAHQLSHHSLEKVLE